MNQSAFWSMCHGYYHGFEQFRMDYREHFGKDAYEGAVVHFRWYVIWSTSTAGTLTCCRGVGKSMSAEEHKTHVEELKVFRKRFDENVMTKDPDSLSDAIMIMQYGSANPKYRDQPNE
jgi:hypothetical protein